MARGPSATETRPFRTLFALGAVGMLSDGQLLHRFAARDGDPSELAFAALVERHGPMVLRVSRATLGDEHAAHDAFQATFLILARQARTLWVRDSLGPWLLAVAGRVASKARSRETRRAHRERSAAKPEASGPLDADIDRDRLDLIRAIHEEVDRLPPPFRLAVVACHLEGLTQHEAALRLGWAVGTLQSRLARGRRKLRERLIRRGLAPSLAPLANKLWPGVPQILVASTARLASAGSSNPLIPPTVLAMIETTRRGMLMVQLKFGALALVVATGLIGSGLGLGNGQQPDRAIGQRPAGEPGFSVQTAPLPWKTAVRIKVRTPGVNSPDRFASGAIIDSTPERDDHPDIRLDFPGKTGPAEVAAITGEIFYDGRILVNLTQSGPVDQSPSRATCLPGDIDAELLVFDFAQGLALIAIRPGRKLPASPILRGSKIDEGMMLKSVGCSKEGDVLTWETEVIASTMDLSNIVGQMDLGLLCTRGLKEESVGGGLFTAQGQLVGIAIGEVSSPPQSLYTRPEPIRRLLDRAGLSKFYHKSMSQTLPPLGQLSPSDQVANRVGEGEGAFPPPAAEPVTPPGVSDRDRIALLEQKLDQILRALAELKANSPPALLEGSFPKGDFPLRKR